MTRERIAREAAELPDAERMALAIDLWSSVDPTSATADDLPLTTEQRDEQDRPIESDDADSSPPERGDVLRAKLLRKEF